MIAKASTSTLQKHHLEHPNCFPHFVSGLRVLEQDFSWVILTGTFAYKIRKPVEIDFLDYSTPGKRQRCCRLELEFNKQFAPDVFLDVVPISMIAGELRFDDASNVIDHAIKMNQLPS